MNLHMKSWNTFKPVFQQQILPFYEKHENTFDFAGVHGRMHISRALVLGECMLRYYHHVLKIENVNFDAVRMAIAFHDAGRQGNGKDIWEEESASLCYQFLIDAGHVSEYCQSVSNMISCKDVWPQDIPAQVLHDADALEIMRLFAFSEHGFQQFRKKELRFLSKKDVLVDQLTPKDKVFRQAFITAAWQWIKHTENTGYTFNNDDFLDRLIDESVGEFATLEQLLAM